MLMVHLVCLLTKKHLLALLQDNCFNLLCCAFLRKMSRCMRNISVLSTPTEANKIVLADTDISVKSKYFKEPLVVWN